MTKTLYVTGKMYEANTVSITDAELESLLAAQQSDEEFWENLEDLHDRLMGDSEVNGFRVSEGIPRFRAAVDDEEISFSELGVDYSKTKITQGKARKLESHILVFEKWSDRGCWSCDLEDEFDKDSLDLSATAYTLPTGEIQHVVEACYEDHDFEYGDRWTEDSSTYIVTKDGNVIELDRA
jgi:hypothetical protein